LIVFSGELLLFFGVFLKEETGRREGRGLCPGEGGGGEESERRRGIWGQACDWGGRTYKKKGGWLRGEKERKGGGLVLQLGGFCPF